MAYGQVVSVQSGTHNQQYVPSGASYPAIAILNPNDGIIFVSNNADCLGTSVGQWDYKIPSQSYAALPGPWLSAGLYYVDQSGSGAAGQITLYPIPSQIPFPQFQAIGRAIQTIGTTLDITESPQPSPPGGGILRLWADTGNNLNILNSVSVNCELLSTCNYGALISNLTFSPTVNVAHSLGVGGVAFVGSFPAGSPAVAGDLIVNRGGSPGTGAVYFGGSAGAHYIYYTSTAFQISDTTLVLGTIQGTYLYTTDGSNGIVQALNGSLYLRSAGAANEVIIDTGSNGLLVSSGPIQAANGSIWIGSGPTANLVWTGGANLRCDNNLAVSLLLTANSIQCNTNLNVDTITVDSAANSGGAKLAFPQATGNKISLYDNGGGSFYGMGINPSEIFICYTGAVRMRNTNGAGAVNFILDGGGQLNIAGDLHCVGLFASQALTWNGAFSGGSVVASGGSHVSDWLVVVNGNVYRIQLWQ